MKLTFHRPQNLPIFQVSLYIFLLTLLFKGAVMWESAFPSRDNLIRCRGTVRSIHLGARGQATYFEIESSGKTARYSSYYGRVWPGMESLARGDHVELLAEKKKLKRLGEKEKFWIWELSAGPQIIVKYEDMLTFRRQAAREQNSVADVALICGTLLFAISSIRKKLKPSGKADS